MKSLFTIMFALFGFSVLAQTVNVTFQVDMSFESVNPNGVSIGGSFQNWAPENGGMTEIGGGIWEISYSINANSSVQFKFINGNSWSNQIESVPTECGVNDGFGGYNRSLMVGDADLVFGPVCFGECSACVPEELVEVSFSVDMSNEVVNPSGVHVAGDFQGWNPATSELLPVGDGIYEATFLVPVSQTIYFKFINGNDWPQQESVPSDCGIDDGFGGFNRFLELGTLNAAYGPVCFGGCYSCGESVPVLVNFSVDLSNEQVSSEGVFMTGNFNGFDPAGLQMSAIGGGIYEAVLVLNPGSTIEYKFLNGPSFDGEELVPEECGIADGFGSFNRSYAVGPLPEVVETDCFSGCGPCPTAANFEVTLLLNMAEEVINPAGVYVAGSFNGFDPSATPMSLNGDGLYEVTITAAAEEVLLYKFLNGNSFDNEEEVPSDCGQPDGFGGYNRAVYVDEDLSLDPVCFGACEDCAVNVSERELQLRVWPNPSSGKIFVRNDLSRSLNLDLFDANGALLRQMRVSAGELRLFDLFDLPSGLYLIRETGAQGSIKLIRE